MQDDELPNFYIIGAPKCGTSSMFRWLADHPQVCSSSPKETWFFADRELDYVSLRFNHRRDPISDYLKFFEPTTSQSRIKMEGSVHYLYSKPALENLGGFPTLPKILIQLRDPATRIWSHFNYIRQKAKAPVNTEFPAYVDILLDSGGNGLPMFTDDAWSQFLLAEQLEFSHYAKYLGPWRDRFPVDHFRLMVFEEFIRAKPETLSRLCAWLGLDRAFYDQYEFRKQNVTQTSAAKQWRKRTRLIKRVLPGFVRRSGPGLIKRLTRGNTSVARSEDLKAIGRLADYFAPLNESLERDFGVDNSRWQQRD